MILWCRVQSEKITGDIGVTLQWLGHWLLARFGGESLVIDQVMVHWRLVMYVDSDSDDWQ